MQSQKQLHVSIHEGSILWMKFQAISPDSLRESWLAFHTIHHGIEINIQTFRKKTFTEEIFNCFPPHSYISTSMTLQVINILSRKKMLFGRQKGSVEHEERSIKAS